MHFCFKSVMKTINALHMHMFEVPIPNSTENLYNASVFQSNFHQFTQLWYNRNYTKCEIWVYKFIKKTNKCTSVLWI